MSLYEGLPSSTSKSDAAAKLSVKGWVSSSPAMPAPGPSPKPAQECKDNHSEPSKGLGEPLKAVGSWTSGVRMLAPQLLRKPRSTVSQAPGTKKIPPTKPVVLQPATTILIQPDTSNSTDSVFVPNKDTYDPSKPNDYEEFHSLRSARLARYRKRWEVKAFSENGYLGIDMNEFDDSERGYNVSSEESSCSSESSEEDETIPSTPSHLPVDVSDKMNALGPSESKEILPPVAKDRPATNSIVGVVNHPTRIVLLKNMVASIDEVDGNLRDEVEEECSSKYGPVLDVIVEVLPPLLPISNPADRVRIFVKFESKNSSVKAARSLNGRFFGGRLIETAYFDETLFGSSD
eukprot:Sdes_comp13051_c0_seq1m3046